MPRYDVCAGRPGDLALANLCLDELSKNVKGELRILDAEPHECPKLDCRTLTTEHSLLLEVSSHNCDSRIGSLFDGRFVSKDLTSVFVDGSGERRGMHTGTFVWKSPAGVLRGQMAGLTNEGTHREPAFRACQVCDQRGVMEGRLCGRLIRADIPGLDGAQVTAAYRLAFDPTERGGEGAVVGTVEGLVVRECDTSRECAVFQAVGQGANPRPVGGSGSVLVETRDLGGPTPVTSVVTWGATTGLHLWHSATATFAPPVSRVELTLVHFAVPATVTAYDAGGVALAGAVMTVPQQVPETLVLAAPGIVSVVVDSPQDEVLMPQLCWQH